jgi:hypothetical protein
MKLLTPSRPTHIGIGKWVTFLLFAFTLWGYMANHATLSACDAIPNGFLAFNWLENHSFTLNSLVDSGVQNPGCLFAVPGHDRLGSGQQWISFYPIGPAIVTAPLYLIFYIYIKLTHLGTALNISSLEFQPTRALYEKWAAAIVAATSVVILFQLSKCLFKRRIALFVAWVFAFGTSTWTTSSQGLWQHGPLNLMVIVMLWGLLRAEPARNQARDQARDQARWLMLAGFACGLLPGIRPTSIVFCLVGLIYAIVYFRPNLRFFLCGGLSVLPALIWNTYWFSSPLLGAYQNVSAAINLALFPEGFWGILFSPGRGLFVFSPIVFFALPGLVVLLQRWRRPADQLILGTVLACGLTVISYSCFLVWWGGGSYGPRFLTDIMPTTCLLIGYCLTALLTVPPWHPLRLFFSTLLGGATVFSVLAQCAGILIEPAYWNANPISVDTPDGRSRLWQWSDSQLMRHINGLINTDRVDRVTTPSAIRDYRGQILSWSVQSAALPSDLSADRVLTGTPNQAIVLAVQVQNTGKVPWYGYKYGTGRGQALLQGAIFAQQPSRRVVAQAFLHPVDRIDPGQTAAAIGSFFFPAVPGEYEVLFWPGLGGMAVPNPDPNLAYRIQIRVVTP